MSDARAARIHLVGSIPLGSADEVFRAVSTTLGELVERIPDGETGERTGWVGFQVPMFAAHPAFELVPSDAAGERSDDVDRVARAEGNDYTRPYFRLRAEVDEDELTFANLGYADHALASYTRFAGLKAEGVIPAGTRFQVSLPTPMAPLVMFVPPHDHPRVEPTYRAAMLAELDRIQAGIPPHELAIQWDVATEIAQLEGVWESAHGDTETVVVEELARLGDAVADGVALGFHLCYGDLGHQHFVQPRDTGTVVNLANSVHARLSRPLDWVHLPVPRDRDDPAYFAPLDSLALSADTELYLGLIHATDGVAGARRRSAAASRHRERFGVATECGFGRRDPATIPALLELHRAVAEDRRAAG